MILRRSAPLRGFVLSTLFAFSAIACAAQDQPEKAPARASEKPSEKALENAPEKSRVPTKPKTEPGRATGAHILISHVEAEQQLPGVGRSKDEAKALATEVLVEARKAGTSFEELVKKHSDEPQAQRRLGRFPVLRRTQFRGPFDGLGEALFGMEVGQVSNLVETPMGYHIVMRYKIVEYSASHILVQYVGSSRAGPNITRTKEEAQTRAEEALGKARGGEDFAKLALEYSDGPSGPTGGKLGIFGPGQMVPAFEEAVSKLKVGGLAGPVETDFGFHVILRTSLDRIGASHVLVQYKGSQQAKPEITRSKEEAKARAEEVRKKAMEAGADFAAIAIEYSDGPSGPGGGDLGLFEKGRMVPAFEKAAFVLEVGQVSAVVETPFGFHVIKRTE